MYIVDNRYLFITSQAIHNINTRSNLKFHIQVLILLDSKKGYLTREFNSSVIVHLI